MTVTTEQYTDFDKAYAYFNKKLFEGKLPECLITLQRKPRMAGYHWFEKFISRDGKRKISELALNPDVFNGQTDIEVLDTMTHEMCHVQQHFLGTAPRKGYHDRQFSELMFKVGLQTSSTGEPGGKATGQSMSDYIIPGGQFEIVATAFLLAGNKIHWDSKQEEKAERKKKKTREKFTCPTCMQSAQAKRTANLMCGDCVVKMVIEEDDE